MSCFACSRRMFLPVCPFAHNPQQAEGGTALSESCRHKFRFKTHSNIGDAQTFALLIAAGAADHVSGQSRQAFGVCCSLSDLKAVRPQT
mgnify:CR=1 FL=1